VFLGWLYILWLHLKMVCFSSYLHFKLERCCPLKNHCLVRRGQEVDLSSNIDLSLKELMGWPTKSQMYKKWLESRSKIGCSGNEKPYNGFSSKNSKEKGRAAGMWLWSQNQLQQLKAAKLERYYGSSWYLFRSLKVIGQEKWKWQEIVHGSKYAKWL